MALIIMLPTSTQIRIIKLLRNALPMLALFHAMIKLSKFKKFLGRVMTLVLAYSSSVLKAVKIQDTMGPSATKAAKISSTYLQILMRMRFILIAFIRSASLSLGYAAAAVFQPFFHSLLGVGDDHDEQ